MAHEIGPALRTTTVHTAHTVYKDYDGNAPDGPVMATCATEALAEEVRAYLEKYDPRDTENAPDDQEEPPAELVECPWPYVEGWEWAARWSLNIAEVPREEIATTFEEALRQICP